jgi:hypothetical protein
MSDGKSDGSNPEAHRKHLIQKSIEKNSLILVPLERLEFDLP